MTVQAFRLKRHVNLSIERARKIALDHHTAESFFSSRLHLRTIVFAPIQIDGIVAQRPIDRHAAAGHRKGAEFRGVDREFVQRQSEILRRFRLERDGRSSDRKLIFAAADISGQLGLNEFTQGCAVPAFAHQQIVRGGQGLQSRGKLIEKPLDRPSVTRGLARHCLNDREKIFRTMGQLAHQ